MFNEWTIFQQISLITVGFLNLRAFFLFYVDKKRAIKKKYRISEHNLLFSALIFGGIGAWIGMKMFRHKTKHSLFQAMIPFSVWVTMGLIYFLIYKIT